MIGAQTAPGLPIPAPAVLEERFELPSQQPLIERVQTAMLEGSRDPWTRDVSLSLTRGMDWRDRHGIALKLLRWVQSRIRYTEDPAGTDYVQRPQYTLERREGDCVAQTVLLGSLLIARGIPATAIYQDPDGQGIGHVFILADLDGDGGGVPLDPIDYSRPAAYTPPGSLFVARGTGRATQLEAAPMLAATVRRRSMSFFGSGATYGMGRLRAARAIGQTEATADAEKEEAAEVDWLRLGLGGALGALAGGLTAQEEAKLREQGIDPATIYSGGTRRPPAPPAASTMFGLTPIVAVGLLALVVFFFMRRRNGARAKAA